jgi:hypothetical protein
LDLPLPMVSYRWSRIRNNTFAACAIVWLVLIFAGLALEVLSGMPAKYLLLVVLPLLALGAGLWLRRQIDTIRRTRKGNIALTVAVIAIMEVVVIGLTVMVISRYPTPPPSTIGDRLALTLAAFGITAEPDFDSADIRGSVLVPVHYTYWESNRQGNVSTEVYRPVSKTLARWMYDGYVKDLEKSISEQQARGWGFEKEVTYFTPEEAAIWGADVGVAVFIEAGGDTGGSTGGGSSGGVGNDATSGPAPGDADYLSPDANTFEMILLNGRTILHLSFHCEGVGIEDAAAVVRVLWGE